MVKRVNVRKLKDLDIEGKHLLEVFRDILKIENITKVELSHRYDIEGIEDTDFYIVSETILAELNVDYVSYKEDISAEYDLYIPIALLKGQYDQRADSARQCIELYNNELNATVKYAKGIGICGSLNESEKSLIKEYLINKVDSEEVSVKLPKTLKIEEPSAEMVDVLEGFIDLDNENLEAYYKKENYAMTLSDLIFCQKYFREEKRNPTVTELKVIDTYWSDHCRHTTFNTTIKNVEFDKGLYAAAIEKAYLKYKKVKELYDNKKDMSLMNLAVINSKELKKRGILNDLDESEEINACSIKLKVETDKGAKEYLLQFKNETHNHPTEIEPFGGAATCLGGAIRDPLAGRAYVYQGMRVTGSADPNEAIKDTRKGKLPQIKITKDAANGFSSYGNQIGLATGEVTEYYHSGFKAKRMEVGAVIGVVASEDVRREEPLPGDKVLLIGGRTGRDGCGGATGSSKKHDLTSIELCGAEVQKGNPVEERKLQRLFRNPEFTNKIKRCNDFGAGGVSVAVGELSRGLEINLDNVPKKYAGLNGTEIAISESQERMAVVVSAEDVDYIINLANQENTEGSVIADIIEEDRLKMFWNGQQIVDIDRKFLDTNGINQEMDILVKTNFDENYFSCIGKIEEKIYPKLTEDFKNLNSCFQKNLIGQFDSSIGGNSVLLPFGGKYQDSPSDGMAALIPLGVDVKSNVCSLMSHGYNPEIAEYSPFHGGIYAVLTSVAKIVAMGGNYKKIRLSLQEYFERIDNDKEKWGKPFSALLGAFEAQHELEIAAIGGKDSMSGTFEELHVPPTLISFAVTTQVSEHIISQEFKQIGNRVIYLNIPRDEYDVPRFEVAKRTYETINKLNKKGQIISAKHIGVEGLAKTLGLMCFGNRLGIKIDESINQSDLFDKQIGSLIVEVSADFDLETLKGLEYKEVGYLKEAYTIEYKTENISLAEMYEYWTTPLAEVFKAVKNEKVEIKTISGEACKPVYTHKHIKPKVLIPIFPGTNCEYDIQRKFIEAGAITELMVFKNYSAESIRESMLEFERLLNNSQILAIPGGFSAGDEPAGSGKFIAAVLKNERIREGVNSLLYKNDGLVLGICNGFQALIKTGLLPFGEIKDIEKNMPTLVHNEIGRHISTIVQTRIVTNKSPWLQDFKVGDIHDIAVSHGEGRLIANKGMLKSMIDQNLIATQYVDFDGEASMDGSYNPNGSICAIEGLISPDGRVLGKMGHSERYNKELYKNKEGNYNQDIFKSGVEYYTK